MKSIIRIPLLLALAGLGLSSCEKFVAIDYPPTNIGSADAFASDASATSVVLNMYSTVRNGNPVSNNLTMNWTGFAGLLSDELEYTPPSATLEEFEGNTVNALNSSVTNGLWGDTYSLIRQANLAIYGITNSTGMTPAGKSQLLGETKFWRAYAFYMLVNYFGDVPLSISSDEFVNAALPRASSAQVWAQIITDLKEAKASLPAAYVGSLRTRINKHAASALLARAYLYTKDYANASAEASEVLSSGIYSLAEPAQAFVNTSNEIIFQAGTFNSFSVLGANYRNSQASTPPIYVLKTNFVRSFEAGDKRRSSWVDSLVIGTTTYQRINKYKLQTATATNGNEYNVMLRLPELYLIRAEAQANQNQLAEALSDLNIIRSRAGLAASSATTQTSLINAILQERKVEFFGEFGHRWFDLKRTNQADAVLAPLKPGWKSTAVLMPIPSTQIQANPVLTQNPGY